MNKFIVTTTINEPTEALIKFSEMKDWKLLVVGDMKTPHHLYKKLNCIYLDPEYQDMYHHALSEAIGWNCIMRRNIGFIEAYRWGADIIATVDDDNIPYENWGKDLLVGKEVKVNCYDSDEGIVIDPLQLTNHKELWHRGFPIELLTKRDKIKQVESVEMTCKIQADLWDGDPDVDALCRIAFNPKDLKLEIPHPFTTNCYTPFNSQNTFLHRDVLPYYMCLPHIGRMDDIWGGLLAQYFTGESVVFNHASVYQKRNEQSLEKNLRDELLGYVRTFELINDIHLWRSILPEPTIKAYELYRDSYAPKYI